MYNIWTKRYALWNVAQEGRSGYSMDYGYYGDWEKLEEEGLIVIKKTLNPDFFTPHELAYITFKGLFILHCLTVQENKPKVSFLEKFWNNLFS